MQITSQNEKTDNAFQIITNRSGKEIKEHGNYDFPILVSRERLSKYESGSFLWHWHPEIELTLITKGEMLYQINDHTYYLHEQDALFGNANALHTGCMIQNRDCAYTSITFDPRLIYGYENSAVYTKYVKPVIHNFSLSSVHFDQSLKWHKAVLQLIHDIIETASLKYDTYELDISMKLGEFWKMLYLHTDTMPVSSLQQNTRNYDRIRDMLSFIEDNYASKLTLEDIADEIHLCKSECCRTFKKYMKISLWDFILQYRIEKSIDYLPDENYTVTDIAAMVGFNDSNYFSKVFHKQKGCSPTAYRTRMLLHSTGNVN